MTNKTAYVVIQTGTNRDHQVFGTFKTEEEAEGFKYKMGGTDHLHEFEVHEVMPPDATDEEE